MFRPSWQECHCRSILSGHGKNSVKCHRQICRAIFLNKVEAESMPGRVRARRKGTLVPYSSSPKEEPRRKETVFRLHRSCDGSGGIKKRPEGFSERLAWGPWWRRLAFSWLFRQKPWPVGSRPPNAKSRCGTDRRRGIADVGLRFALRRSCSRVRCSH